jgi:CrcB protein
MARHGVNVLMARWLGQPTHLATLLVNLIGCALIGILPGLLAGERLSMKPSVRLFMFVGVLGGFTTFSSFGLDSFTLATQGRHGTALLNVAIQVILGLAAVAGGYFLAMKL